MRGNTGVGIATGVRFGIGVRVEDGLGVAELLGNATGVGVGLIDGVGVLNFGATYKAQIKRPLFFVQRYFFFNEIVVDPNFLQAVPLIVLVAPSAG